MSLLSEIISKPVLNLYSGKIEGTIKDATFDSSFKKIRYFKIFDDDEEEYLLDTNKIYSLGSSSVVIKNSGALSLIENSKEKPNNNPINLNIYSAFGDNLGKLADIEIEDNFEVKNFITNDMVIKPENIINIGNIIIINNTEKKIKHSYFKPKVKIVKKIAEQNLVKILPTINFEAKVIESEPVEEKPEPVIADQQKEAFKIYNEPTPQRIVGNGNFLIGRKAIKTIYGLNNEIIIKKDNIINSKNLEIAKKHSKLVELTIFSKIKA